MGYLNRTCNGEFWAIFDESDTKYCSHRRFRLNIYLSRIGFFATYYIFMELSYTYRSYITVIRYQSFWVFYGVACKMHQYHLLYLSFYLKLIEHEQLQIRTCPITFHAHGLFILDKKTVLQVNVCLVCLVFTTIVQSFINILILFLAFK